jgi:hypothetical protein
MMDKHIEELDRQEFETWFISLFHPHHMNRNESGSYYFIDANVAWTAWQERGKALLAKLEAAEKQVKEMTEQYLDRNTALTFVTLRAEAAEARLLVPVIRQQHAEWSNATFGNVGPIGPLKHLSKEALETAAAPNDLSEWADMQFLFWDAQRRAGITDEQLEQAMIEKLEINKSRTWPEPKDGEPREHIKAGFKVEGG